MFRRVSTVLLLFISVAASPATVHVDEQLTSDCDDYDANSRTCGEGSDIAVHQFARALRDLRPGDTLLLRGGRYPQINVTTSGTPDAPITIRAFPGETAAVTGPRIVALWVIGQSNVVIEDLVVKNVIGFGRLEESENVTIRNVEFVTAHASGTTGGLKFVRSSHNRVESCSFDDGSDLLLFQDDSDFNVLVDSRFHRASHSEISIRCSNQNVVRGNEFYNPDQKAVEIYDCEGVSDAPVRLDATKWNLFERNRFVGTAPAGRNHLFNAMQHGGQGTIVRHNIYTGNRGGGVNYQSYARESLFVHGNRLYNNTFYANDCNAIIGQTGRRDRYHDNRAVNNLLFANRDCRGGDYQTDIRDRRAVIVAGNGVSRRDPGFVDADNRDFRLDPASRWIDAGDYVTTTQSRGKGRTLVVTDASWFFDGFGIAGEVGDVIRIEGETDSARITAIDYATNTLTLDEDLRWRKGAGVHIEYAGSAPDVGAFEFSADGR